MQEPMGKDNPFRYAFTASTWKYDGPCTWHFVSLPAALTREIRLLRKADEEGWGRLKTVARIGNSEWKTAIWFDTKHDTYLLPIKAEIRRKEKIEIGGIVNVTIWF